MKKYTLIILILLYAVQATAEESRKIIIRGDNAFPPYEFINDKGEPDGFNVDLTRAIMAELQQPYDLQLENWPYLLRQFENNEVDLITGIAKSKERGDKFNYSNPHSFVDYKFVCRKDAPIHNAGELSKKGVIVQENAVPHVKLKSMHYDNLIVVNDMDEGLRKLSEGIGDVAICPDNMAQGVIYKNGLTDLDIIDPGWPVREYCYAAHDTKLLERINWALARLKENGEYDRIRTKWLGAEPAFHIPAWVYSLIGALVLTGLLLFIFVRIYKMRAKKGEALLIRQNETLNTSLSENKILLNRYMTMFNTTLVGLSYYDKDGILLDVNDEMVKLFQSETKDDLLKNRISIYQNPFLREYGIVDGQNQVHEYSGLLKYDMRKGHCPEYFARFAPYNKIFYFKMTVTPIKNSKDELEGILITAMDRTAEENHDRQMVEEEAKLTLALEAGNIAAWIYDPQAKMFYTLRGNALAGTGISMEDNLKILHPDDRTIQEELLGSLCRGEKEGGICTFRYLHENGTYRYYENRMSVQKEDGQVTAILGTQKDVTTEVLGNKILSEMVCKLQFAIRTAGMTMWEFDCLTRMFSVFNDPLADYKDGAELSVNNPGDIFEREGTNWEEVANATRIVKGQLDEPFNIAVKLKTKYDSDWQYCTISGMPMEKDEAGNAIKYAGVRINVTEQVEYQKILEREKEQAQQADKLKSAFLANMSHEIRTPLNAIVGFSELIQTEEDPASKAEYMNIININNELLLRLISDILDLSKIESGFMELQPELFDLSEVFNETYTSLSQRCNNPEVTFVYRNPYKHCRVKLDRNRLIQVGANFMTNALKHTPKGRILMGYEYTDGGIRIYVEDTGCGIPKEKQGQLFQRFAKLDDFTQGTGLGLAICKAIVDAQGGKIGAESEEGKGSTFWAWFPCQARIEVLDETEQEHREIAAAQTNDQLRQDPSLLNQRCSLSVLVAEDIDSNYMLIKAILKTCKLTRAKTGQEAVDLVVANSYDVILMDMKMPVMDGIMATRKIREFDRETPIIAVTANAFDSAKEEALRAGCNAFVTKPVKKSELEEIFRNIPSLI